MSRRFALSEAFALATRSDSVSFILWSSRSATFFCPAITASCSFNFGTSASRSRMFCLRMSSGSSPSSAAQPNQERTMRFMRRHIDIVRAFSLSGWKLTRNLSMRQRWPVKVHGVSDLERREHERLAREGDLAAQVRMLRDRVRDGTLSERRLELAAYCHVTDSPETAAELAAAAAWEFLEPSQRPPLRATTLRSWAVGLAHYGAVATVHAMLPAARDAGLGAEIVTCIERWLAEPTLANVPPRFDTQSALERSLRALFSSVTGGGLLGSPSASAVAAVLENVRVEGAAGTMVDALVGF